MEAGVWREGRLYEALSRSGIVRRRATLDSFQEFLRAGSKQPRGCFTGRTCDRSSSLLPFVALSRRERRLARATLRGRSIRHSLTESLKNVQTDRDVRRDAQSKSLTVLKVQQGQSRTDVLLNALFLFDVSNIYLTGS